MPGWGWGGRGGGHLNNLEHDSNNYSVIFALKELFKQIMCQLMLSLIVAISNQFLMEYPG